MNDLCQKMEGKTNFSRHLKQFDGLTWLTSTPYFTTDLRHCPGYLCSFPTCCQLQQPTSSFIIISLLIQRTRLITVGDPTFSVAGSRRWTSITDMRGDLQTESSGWLFKSPFAVEAGHIVAANNRPHSLLYPNC